MTDSEIRNAAEVILASSNACNFPSSGVIYDIHSGNIHDQQRTSVNNSSSSLEGIYVDSVATGIRLNDRMSATRQFFCCFVLFDLLLISLTWLICMVVIDGNIIKMLKMQILHYSITTSFFDIAALSLCRFVILLLFYGILHFNTTFFIAFTTSSTCLFIIVKVVYYSWTTASQPAFHAIIILMSFIVSWLETWFFAFRVIPQELFALQLAKSKGRYSESLNNLLLDPHLRNSLLRRVHNDTREDFSGNFYSPLESPDGSDNESDEQRIPSKRSTNFLQNEEFLRRGKDALEFAWNALNSPDWKIEKVTEEEDCVLTKQHKTFGKFFLLKTKINIKAETLHNELFKNIDRLTTWNKAVLESRRLLVVDDHTDVTYQVSAPGGNGIITSRDFVNVRHWVMKEDAFVLAGISVPYPPVSVNQKYIRGENGPCCWVVKPLENGGNDCTFQFLLNTNLRGWIPHYVVDSALTSLLLEYSNSLKGYCQKLTKYGGT